MTLDGIKYINQCLDGVVDYSYMRYWGDFNKTYWVGETYENTGDPEDGSLQSTLIITGTTTGTWVDLLEEKGKIKKALVGNKAMLENGSIGVYFDSGQAIPSDDEKIKRYQLKLTVYEWEKGI